MQQVFTEMFGRSPSNTELADMVLAIGIGMHTGLQTAPSQIMYRAQQMATPGTPLNAFMMRFARNLSW